MKLLNALSLNMYDADLFPVTEKISCEKAKELLFPVHCDSGEYSLSPLSRARKELHPEITQLNNCESCIGHADTARVLSTLLQKEIPCNRVTVQLKQNEKFIVAQYIGPRLPEGATVLPEGATIKFFLVKMEVKEKYLKMISLQKDIANLAHDIAGWGDSISMDEVKKVLEKHFPHYFSEHAFD
jgi:hypothetical protein